MVLEPYLVNPCEIKYNVGPPKNIRDLSGRNFDVLDSDKCFFLWKCTKSHIGNILSRIGLYK